MDKVEKCLRICQAFIAFQYIKISRLFDRCQTEEGLGPNLSNGDVERYKNECR